MTQEHPITPPLELIREWALNHDYTYANELWDYIATQAARWGADQELEACCEWIEDNCYSIRVTDHLRTARRPKPPSLKEQALQALALLKVDASTHGLGFDSSTIRRALESLPD